MTAGIQCDCGSYDTRVIRTQPGENCNTRRIECRTCKARMTTIERRVTGRQPSPTATDNAFLALSIAELLKNAGVVPVNPLRPSPVADNSTQEH